MRISDWSSDVCSSDLVKRFGRLSMVPDSRPRSATVPKWALTPCALADKHAGRQPNCPNGRRRSRVRITRVGFARSEEHTYELQSLMRNSYAVLCLKNKKDIRYM